MTSTNFFVKFSLDSDWEKRKNFFPKKFQSKKFKLSLLIKFTQFKDFLIKKKCHLKIMKKNKLKKVSNPSES